MTDEHLVSEVDMKTVRFPEWLLLAWSFSWRGIITAIGSMIVTGMVFILGYILFHIAMMNGIYSIYSAETIHLFLRIFGGVIGFFIGMCFNALLLQWIFKTKFKRFRVTLVELNGTRS